MSFTVEPGVYVSPDNATLKLSLLEYDADEWTERRMMLGAAAAKKLEAAEREAAGFEECEVPAAFLGIGVRIEDDVFLTEDGLVNLTGSLPTDPDDVEALCAESATLPPEWAAHAQIAEDPLIVSPAEIEANRDEWTQRWVEIVLG